MIKMSKEINTTLRFIELQKKDLIFKLNKAKKEEKKQIKKEIKAMDKAWQILNETKEVEEDVN